MVSYFLGVCQDFKHFGFAVSVIILNEQGNKVVRVLRKEACYVRSALANKEGVIPCVVRELVQFGAGGTGGGHSTAQPAKFLDGLADASLPWLAVCRRLTARIISFLKKQSTFLG